MPPLTIQSKYSIRLGVAGLVLALSGYMLTIPLPDFLWMAIAAFMVVDNRVGVTIRQGLHRAAGSIVGAVLGVVLTSFFPVHSVWNAIFVFTIIGFVSAYAYTHANTLRLTAMTAAIVYVSIATGQVSEYFPWQLGLHRAFDNILGIVVMVIVTILVFPTHATEQWHDQARQLWQQCSRAFLLMQHSFSDAQHSSISALVKTVHTSYQKLQTATTDRYWEDALAKLSPSDGLTQLQRLSRLQHVIGCLLAIWLKPNFATLPCYQSELAGLLAAFHRAFDGTYNAQHRLKDCDASALHTQLQDFKRHIQSLRDQAILATADTATVQYLYQTISLLQLLLAIDEDATYEH